MMARHERICWLISYRAASRVIEVVTFVPFDYPVSIYSIERALPAVPHVRAIGRCLWAATMNDTVEISGFWSIETLAQTFDDELESGT